MSGKEDDNTGAGGGAGVLTADDVKAALSGVGIHPHTLSSALLAVNLSGRGLKDVSALRAFPRLQRVDVSDNKLDDEALYPVLAALPHLKSVNARGNNLTRVLDYDTAPVEDNLDDTDFHVGVGSLIEVADLSGNAIEAIGDLSAHRFLRELILDDNRVGAISGLSGLDHLAVLSLDNNAVKSISGLDGSSVEVLSLQGNELTSINGLTRVPRLRHLNVRANAIGKLGPNLLSEAKFLTDLDLQDNRVDEVAQLSYLEPCARLLRLDTRGNPMSTAASEGDAKALETYKLRVLYRLPSLEFLDGDECTALDTVAAQNLHGVDVHARKAAFEAAVPELPFENTVPPLVDESLKAVAGPLFLSGRKVAGTGDFMLVSVAASKKPTNVGGFYAHAHSATNAALQLSLDVTVQQARRAAQGLPALAPTAPPSRAGSDGGGGSGALSARAGSAPGSARGEPIVMLPPDGVADLDPAVTAERIAARLAIVTQPSGAWQLVLS